MVGMAPPAGSASTDRLPVRSPLDGHRLVCEPSRSRRARHGRRSRLLRIDDFCWQRRVQIAHGQHALVVAAGASSFVITPRQIVEPIGIPSRVKGACPSGQELPRRSHGTRRCQRMAAVVVTRLHRGRRQGVPPTMARERVHAPPPRSLLARPRSIVFLWRRRIIEGTARQGRKLAPDARAPGGSTSHKFYLPD